MAWPEQIVISPLLVQPLRSKVPPSPIWLSLAAPLLGAFSAGL